MPDKFEGPARKEIVKPIDSACCLSIFPIEEYFTLLVQKQCSKMFFMGQIISFWGYDEPTEIVVSPVGADVLPEPKEAGVVTKMLDVIKILHFKNRDDKEEQLKDFGKILWLLENFSCRQDHFCPDCSGQLKFRFSDIFEFCGKCGKPLKKQAYMSPRYKKKKPLGRHHE